MKIFITGITGFVGASLANYFVSAGHHVGGIGRKPSLPPFVSGLCTYKSVDILHPIEDIEADIVIHAAALASDTITFKQAYGVNVRGTEHVLQACRSVGHFIHISSSSVYNFRDNKIKFEDDSGIEFNGLSAYGQTKWLAEQAVSHDRHDFKKSILRPRAIYGKYDQLLIPRLLKLVKGNRIILPEQLTKQISLTHISNLVAAVNLCVTIQSAGLEIYNVSDREIYDLNIVLPALLKVVLANKLRTVRIPAGLFDLFAAVNRKMTVSAAFNPFAVASLTHKSILNIDKISSQLHYAPTHNFFGGCTEIAEWIHREQGWKNFFKEAPIPNF